MTCMPFYRVFYYLPVLSKIPSRYRVLPCVIMLVTLRCMQITRFVLTFSQTTCSSMVS